MSQKITLQKVAAPKSTQQDITWLVASLGLSAGRDTHGVSQIIVEHSLKEIAKNGFTSTQDLARDLDLSVQRVNYHLRSLIQSGFFVRQKRLIYIREGSVKAAVQEMQHDANRIFSSIMKIGEEIDESLGIENR